MRFVVASYGRKHAGMLLAHLASIARCDPEARVAIYWQDIPAPLAGALRAAFPRYDFEETQFDFSGDYHLRISSKVLAWCHAAEEHASEPRLCFADVDTLVLRGLGSFFERGDSDDVLFTHKPERTALNTGVLLARGRPASVAFFREWRERTLRICRAPELFAQANDYSLGYGASDQMALWQMLGYERGRADYEITCGAERVRLRGEPCAILNETNSVRVTDAHHILHFKGGWQPILLEGRAFSKNRPRETSWPMFTLYLARFREALAALNAAAGTHFTARDFGIVIPSYLEVESGRFHPARYAVWRARETGKSALRMLGCAARRLTGSES